MARQTIRDRFLEAQDRLVFQASDLSLGTVSNMANRGAVNLSPDYQRRERWTRQKQSMLIESFLLNIPVPPIYLAEDEFGKYSVVDGKQRVTAIHNFMTDNLVLTGLETFFEIEGMKYSELPPDLQNALDIRPYLRVVTLLKQSDPTLKFEVFIRLNRGGESMEPQELRNVAFRGPLNDLIYKLSEHDFLRKHLKIRDERSSSYQIMADAELVLRFLTLRSNWKSFSGDYRIEMDRFMYEHASARPLELAEFSKAFTSAIETCQSIWGEMAFKRPSGDGWRDQLLTGLYDAQMVAVDTLSEKEREEALKNTQDIIERTRKLFEDPLFDNAVRQGTNTPGRVIYRVERILDIIS